MKTRIICKPVQRNTHFHLVSIMFVIANEILVAVVEASGWAKGGLESGTSSIACHEVLLEDLVFIRKCFHRPRYVAVGHELIIHRSMKDSNEADNNRSKANVLWPNIWAKTSQVPSRFRTKRVMNCTLFGL